MGRIRAPIPATKSNLQIVRRVKASLMKNLATNRVPCVELQRGGGVLSRIERNLTSTSGCTASVGPGAVPHTHTDTPLLHQNVKCTQGSTIKPWGGRFIYITVFHILDELQHSLSEIWNVVLYMFQFWLSLQVCLAYVVDSRSKRDAFSFLYDCRSYLLFLLYVFFMALGMVVILLLSRNHSLMWSQTALVENKCSWVSLKQLHSLHTLDTTRCLRRSTVLSRPRNASG